MANYNSTHTGQQIDDAVDKANSIEVHTTTTESTVAGAEIKIGNTTYRIKRIFSGAGAPSSQASSGYQVGDVYIDTTNFAAYYLSTASSSILNWSLVGIRVQGTNDGTNWLSLTIGLQTFLIPQGGGGSGAIVGTTAPTVATVGTQGQIYLEVPTTTSILNNIYVMTSNVPGIGYIWTKVNPPTQYIKSATVTNNVLTLTDQSGTSGTDVNLASANPTLAGTEADLTGLQVGGTKYKVSSGLSVLSGAYDPTALTDGALGQLYVNITDKTVFTCTDPTTGATIWKKSTPVSGTNDGTNWTALTIDGVQKAIPQGGGVILSGAYKITITPDYNWGDTYYDFAVLGIANGEYGFHVIHIDANSFQNYISGTIDGETFSFPEGISFIINNVALFINLQNYLHDEYMDLHMKRYDGTDITNNSTYVNSCNKICYLTGDCLFSSID